MILFNAGIPGKQETWHIQVKSLIGKFTQNENELTPDESIDLEGNLCLRGFINSHDHLDFNLFPQLGKGGYSNYSEWGPAVQREYREIIEQVKRVPLELRNKWGIYKNLLNGFTTVVNHVPDPVSDNQLVSVFQDFYFLHSPGFEKNWRWKLLNPLKNDRPFVMHLGEGSDKTAKREIDDVIHCNIFRKNIIAVHGVAMDRRQINKFRGLVWCPASNDFLFGQTVDRALLDNNMVAFGTDSTLTSPWNCWEHFRLALKSVTENKLLAMLGSLPAFIWNFEDKQERMEGSAGDLLVLKKTARLFDSNPSDILLVIKKGEVVLADEKFTTRLKNRNEQYSKIAFGNSVKYVKGDLTGLVKQVKKIFPGVFIPFEIAD
jgi:cytosine/adenosine deaminase-related metal-dependent hydrolase